MKEGWEIKKLDDLCLIELGKTPYRGDKSFWDIEKETKNVWLSIADMLNTDGDVVSDSKEYITDKAAKVSKIVKKGTLLLSFKLTLGRLAFAGKDLFTNEAIAALTIRNEKVIDKYFLYQFLSLFDWDTASDGDVKVKGKTLNKAKLKEIEVHYPKSLPEQQRIVAILDKAFAAIDKAKANTEQNLKNAKELFESYLQGVFENGNWEEKTIDEVCNEIFAGGDAPKNNFSLEPNQKHKIPIFANAVKDKGLYGYTDFTRVTKPCVTIAARGSGTGHTELRNEAFLPIVRLIVCIPDPKQMSNEFLKYTIDNLVIQRSGSAIPQLTVPMIKDYKIPVPTINEQKRIIEKAETLKEQKETIENVYQKKIEGLEEIKKSILQKAFAGELKTEKIRV
jgi:type I restriction enzyme, S subunit